MANVNSWWSSLSPTAKRNLAVGSIGTVLIATIIGLASVSPEVAKPSSKQATIQHILTDSDPRSLGIDGISAQLRDLLQKNEEQGRRLAAIEEQQKREQQSDELRFKQWTSAEREAYDAKLRAVSGELETLKNKPAASGQSAFSPAMAATPSAALPSSNTADRRLSTSRTTPDPNDLSSVFEQAAVPLPNQSSPGVSGGRSSQATQPHAALQIRVIKAEKA
jgi:conjugal transfer pilus assembly protein TraB